MEIKSNVEKTLLESEHILSSKKDDTFKKDIMNSLKNIENIKSLFTLENIKQISLEDIKDIFKNDEDIALAKNLKLSTMFSNDEKLTKVMYETVLNKPLDLGYHFLKDRYDDKFNFLNSDEKSLADLLHLSISSKLSNKTSTNIIEKEKLDMVLLKVNSFSFLDALSNTSKNQYDKYKDKDQKYSFLYSNHHLEYQKLINKYKDLDNYEKQLMKQY